MFGRGVTGNPWRSLAVVVATFGAFQGNNKTRTFSFFAGHSNLCGTILILDAIINYLIGDRELTSLFLTLQQFSLRTRKKGYVDQYISVVLS